MALLRIKNQAGLTLVELMIGVAIISILAAIAVPSYFNDLPRKRLREAARDMLSQTQTARLNAVSSNRRWWVDFDTVNNRYCLMDSGPNGTIDSAVACVASGDDILSQTTSLANYGGMVRFGPGNALTNWNGDLPGQTAAVTFTNRGTNNGAATSTAYLQTNQGGGNDLICYGLAITPGGGIRLRFYNGMAPRNQQNWIE